MVNSLGSPKKAKITRKKAYAAGKQMLQQPENGLKRPSDLTIVSCQSCAVARTEGSEPTLHANSHLRPDE